jgi:Protein of unknown function (DUF3662)/Inner membrane component of T3SS, cytoplasmic domain
MGVLQRFERRIEALVTRPFAKAFKAEVQPVEIASALQRECDQRAAIVARGRTMVPNVFVVELGQRDSERLSPYYEPLGSELADMVVEHAEEQRYTFLGPVRVGFERTDGLDTGIFRIRANAVAGAATAFPSDAAGQPGAAGGAGLAGAPGRAPHLEVNGERVQLAGTKTVVGRGSDADLRIDDPGISRRHAEVRLHGQHATVTDLGSTNGLLLGGRRVSEATLADGDSVVLGSTALVFRSGESG